MKAILLVVVALVAVSCFDKGDCLYVNSNFVVFKVMNKTARSQPLTVHFTSVHTPGQFIWHEKEDLAVLTPGIDPRATETKYVLQYDLKSGTTTTSRSDTVVVGYTSQTRVLSPECGSATFYDNLEIKYSTLPENIAVVNRPLLTTVTNNIEIYL